MWSYMSHYELLAAIACFTDLGSRLCGHKYHTNVHINVELFVLVHIYKACSQY